MGTIHDTNPMREQIIGTPAALKSQYWEIEDRVRKLLSTPEIASIRHIILTGCGDSNMAGLGAQMAFENFTRIPTSVLRSMEAGRYAAPTFAGHPNSPLVVGISSSGEVTRTVEAVQQCTGYGAMSVALTSRPESRIGQSARKTLTFESSSLPSAPGFYSFAASLISLYLMAIRIGEVRGSLTQDEANAQRKLLEVQIDKMEETASMGDEALRKLAADWAMFSNFELLGSGPGFATATFGSAKILEAAGRYVHPQDLEEWAHLQYFLGTPQETPTFLIAPEQSKSFSRAVEISRILDTLKRPWIAITDSSSAANFTSDGIVVSGSVPETYSTLLYTIPLALFAGYLADATGAEYGRGHAGVWAESVDGSTIRNSEMLDPV